MEKSPSRLNETGSAMRKDAYTTSLARVMLACFVTSTAIRRYAEIPEVGWLIATLVSVGVGGLVLFVRLDDAKTIATSLVGCAFGVLLMVVFTASTGRGADDLKSLFYWIVIGWVIACVANASRRRMQATSNTQRGGDQSDSMDFKANGIRSER